MSKVSIGVEVTGVQQAKSDVESFGDALEKIYANLNAPTLAGMPGTGIGGGATKPAGSSPLAPGTTDGLGNYAHPINGSQSQLDWGLGTSNGVLANPFGGYNPKPSPGIVSPAPNPFAGYGSTPPPLIPPGGSGSGPGGGSGGNGPIDVRVVGSVAIHVANLESALASIASGGGGMGGGPLGMGYGAGGGPGGSGGGGSVLGGGPGAGTGQGGPGGGIPANPYAGGFNPFKPGGLANLNGLASTALGFVHNPASLMGLIPAPLALGGAAVTAGFEAAQANYAAYRPTYDLETSLMAAPMRGQLISPLLKPGMSKVAQDQGDIAYYEGHRSTIYGLAGRIGTLGAADWFYNTRIKPVLDRRLATDSAESEANPMRIRFGAATGVRPGDDAALGIKNSLYGAAGGFGTGALSSLQGNGGFNPMVNAGFGSDDAAGVASVIYGAASRQQSGALFSQIRRKADVLGMASSVLPSLIATGDTSSINSLRPKLGNAVVDAAINQARGTFQLGVTSQIDQAGFGAAGAQVSLLSATGAGYRAISGAIGTQAGMLGAVRGDLQKQMALAAAAGNTGEAAQIGTQIKELNAQQAALRQQAAATIFTGRGVENQSLATGASVSMTAALYGGGGQAGVDAAFSTQGKAGLAEAQRLEDMSKSPFISPEQRSLYKQQARQKRQESTLMVDRSRSQFDFSLTQGRLGVAGARAEAGLTHAQMYGDQESVFTSSMVRTNVTARNLDAVNARLSDPSAHLDPAERLDLMQRGIELQRQVNQGLEENKRSLLGMRVATDQAQSSIVHMGNSVQMQFFGAGGQVAGANQVGEIGASRKTLGAAQSNFDYYDGMVKSGKMSASNPDYLKAKQGVISAQGDLYGSIAGMAALPSSLSSRSQLLDSQFAMQMGSKTFLPFGNMRGNLEGGMGAIGSQLKDLDANEREAIRQANQTHFETDAARQSFIAKTRFDFKTQRYGLNGQLASMQNQLQEGWQDRLTSSLVGAPSRFGFVASAFTQHEAANFLQNTDLYNGSFGFSSAKGRDDIMFKYARYMGGMSIGNITRPEGFLNTALSGAHAGVGASPLVGGRGGYGSAGGAGFSGQDGGFVGGGGDAMGRPFVLDGSGGAQQTYHHLQEQLELGGTIGSGRDALSLNLPKFKSAGESTRYWMAHRGPSVAERSFSALNKWYAGHGYSLPGQGGESGASGPGGASGPSAMTGVLKAPPQQVNGVIEVRVVVQTSDGKVMGKGSQKTTIHDLQNGALQISMPTHSLSGGSHQ